MLPPYLPIDCAAHDRLLAYATLGRECEIELTPRDGRPARTRGTIKDVYSRGGAEYLRLSEGGTYRLDEIVAVDGQPIGPAER